MLCYYKCGNVLYIHKNTVLQILFKNFPSVVDYSYAYYAFYVKNSFSIWVIHKVHAIIYF